MHGLKIDFSTLNVEHKALLIAAAMLFDDLFF